MAKDMLFATLDPTMRGLVLPSGRKVILSDTVGFISELPTELVAAFRATLEEVLEADLILHVRDISHPETEEQAADVGDILETLGVDEDVALIEVWNKIDALSEPTREAILATDARRGDVQAVSALSGEGVPALLDAIEERLAEEIVEETLDLPFADGRLRAWLHEQSAVKTETQTETGWTLDLRWTPSQKGRFRDLQG
jgi:GTP-binding protein HflX